MASLLVESFDRLGTEAQFISWLWDVLTDFCSASGHNEESELYRWMEAEELESPEEALATIYNRYIVDYDTKAYRKAVDSVLRESAERGEEKVHGIVKKLSQLIA